MIGQFVFLNDLFYFLLNLFTTGGYEDHFMGPILCFTLRGQSNIRKVPDPENAFNMLFLGRVRVHGKNAESDPFPGGMPTLAPQVPPLAPLISLGLSITAAASLGMQEVALYLSPLRKHQVNHHFLLLLLRYSSTFNPTSTSTSNSSFSTSSTSSISSTSSTSPQASPLAVFTIPALPTAWNQLSIQV